jgi:hypothetical protein
VEGFAAVGVLKSTSVSGGHVICQTTLLCELPYGGFYSPGHESTGEIDKKTPPADKSTAMRNSPFN